MKTRPFPLGGKENGDRRERQRWKRRERGLLISTERLWENGPGCQCAAEGGPAWAQEGMRENYKLRPRKEEKSEDTGSEAQQQLSHPQPFDGNIEGARNGDVEPTDSIFCVSLSGLFPQGQSQVYLE